MPDEELMRRIVEQVSAHGELTRSQILAGLPDVTVPRFVAASRAMIAAGRLSRVGRTRGTRYGLPGMTWQWSRSTDADGVQSGRWVPGSADAST